MQKLADKINERWSGVTYAYYSAEREQLEIYQDAITGFRKGICAYHPSDSDAWNAQFIVWGLERLSEFGWFIVLSPTPDCGWRIEPRVRTEYAEDESLAACVYNALCKALEVEP